jgi:PAS domain S-box-containing protein
MQDGELIREELQAELSAKESEDRFRKLMEHSPMGIAVSDMRGEVAYLNHKFIQLFGYTLQDIPTLDNWWHLAYPDPSHADRIKSEWLKATGEAGEKGTEAEPMEREVRCKDGTIRVIDLRKTVMDKWVIHTFHDVTDYKRQKEALRESEQMFRLLSEQSLMSVAILQDGVYKYANQAMSDLCEYSLQEISLWGAEEFLSVVHPADRELVITQARIKQQGDARQKTHYAFRILTKSGVTKWVEIYSKTVQFKGRPANLITMLDITERKQAEEAVRSSEERLRLAWETCPDYFSISRSRDAWIVDVNRGFTELTGYTRDEVIGRSACELNLWVDVSERLKMVSALTRDGQIRDFETHFRRKNGEIRTVSISAGLMYLDGDPHILALVKDIGEFKRAQEALVRSEELFRRYFELGRVGMALTSPAKGWGYVNDRICEMLGYTRQELGHTTWAALTHPDDLEPDLAQYNRMMAGDIDGYSLDKRFVRKDGSLVHTTLHVSCMRLPDGKVENVIVQLHDISDQKRAEKTLRRYTKELEAINRLGTEIRSSLSLDEVVGRGLRELITVLECDLAMLFLHEDGGLVLKRVESLRDGVSTEKFPVHRVGECLCGLSVKARRPIFSANINNDPRCTWEECKKIGLRAMATIPLMVGDQMVGVLGLGNYEARDFSTEEKFIESLVHQVTMGVRNSLLYEQVQHDARELETKVLQLKRAEESLSLGEKRLRQVIDLVPHFIFAKDLQGRFILVNRAVADAYGTTVDNLTGKTDAEVATSDDEALHFRSDDLEVINSGRPKAIAEERITDANGHVRFLSTVKIPFTFSGADSPSVLGVSVDITDRRKAERALEKALRRSRLQLEAVSEVAVSSALVLGETATLARQITELGAQTLGTERVGVWLFADAGENLTCIDLYESSPRSHSTGAVLKGDQFTNEFEALTKTRYVAAAAPLTDPRTAGYVETYLKPLHITSMLDAVIRRGGENLGLICFEHVDKAHQWGTDEIAFACQVADQFAIALHNHDRRMAEQAVRDSERKYRLLAENVSDVIWTMAPDLTLTYVSPSIERMHGCKTTKWRALTLSDYLTPASKQVALTTWTEEIALQGTAGLDPNRVRTLELEQYRKDGTTFWTEVSIRFLYDDAGRVKGIIGATRDIDERRRSQEQLQRLSTAVQQAGETIMITELDGTVLYVNPAFENTTGYLCNDVIGKTAAILKSGTHNESFYQDMWSTMRRGEVWRGRFTNRKKDGSLYEATATISPIKDESGQVVNYVMVGRDVTSEMMLQKQLNQAQKMEAIGTLAGGIAHDVNNLLQAVLGYADLLLMKKGPGDPDRKKLEVIQHAARDGADLVSRILTFSRKRESKARPIDLNNEIRRSEKLLRRTLPRMIRIDLLLADDLRIIDADPAQMEQILLNLGVNAQHAMPDGGRLLIETSNVSLSDDYLRTHLAAKKGNYVVLTVSDTGIGIESAALDRIFEPFYTTKTNGLGTGLGLAMVHGIVSQHGGYIRCYSEPGVGTTFKIYFPVSLSESIPDLALTREMPAFGTETILLVDDDDRVREMARQMIGTGGYRILTACSGEDALAVYISHRKEIALVILDLIMPGMGGNRCLEELLRIDPDVRVLVASGYSSNGLALDERGRGARGFISKPYDAKDILGAIRRVMDHGRL